MKLKFLALFAAVIGMALNCGNGHADHPMSGGETTLVLPQAQKNDRGIFSRPATNLSLTRRGDFFAGNSFFQNAWVTAPASTTARDGLGPLFNTMSCQSCHIKDGRGRPPQRNEEMLSMLIRLSIDDDERESERFQKKGVVPHPQYGDQIQNRAIVGVQPEARVELEWKEISGQFVDGTRYSLRKPEIKLADLAYGPLPPDIRLSARVAPALIGVGLLDSVPVESLAQLCDPDDENADGISGRLNRVWDCAAGQYVAGRFGWKAEQPNVRQQVAAAFLGDVGITSSLFPDSPLSELQRANIQKPTGGDPEVTDEILDLVTFYCKTLAVPARRLHDHAMIRQGEQLFNQARCNVCHVETLKTGQDELFPELSHQTIHPYTDLLLHDMGPGLADDRPVFEASGSEWRTPPLWSIGLVYQVNRHNNFLHDGRARSIAEAILWHGGEAEESKNTFVKMNQEQRRKLLAFIKSL